MDNYTDEIRVPLVLVWADGTIVVDKPARTSDQPEPLRNYLMGLYTSPYDTEVPTHVFAFCRFCGGLHDCQIAKTSQFIDVDEWIDVLYTVTAVVEPTPGSFTPGHLNGHQVEVTQVALRVDGRG